MTFITCSRKKSMPRVSTSICEKCTRARKCPDYSLFCQPMLFTDLKKDNRPVRKRALKIYENEKSKNIKTEEQLKLSFIG
ncbi:hypothetical protein ACFL1N_12650 [Thermodesulfobacteriota bacterium]